MHLPGSSKDRRAALASLPTKAHAAAAGEGGNRGAAGVSEVEMAPAPRHGAAGGESKGFVSAPLMGTPRHAGLKH